MLRSKLKTAVSGAIGILVFSGALWSQQTEKGYLYVCLSGPGTQPFALENQVLRISVLQEGVLKEQQEARIGYAQFTSCGGGGGIRSGGLFSIPVGTYDVRVDGPGAVTVIKRGLNVIASSTSTGTGAIFDMKPGDGTRVVEYEASTLSRDELTARVAQLEDRLKALEDAVLAVGAMLRNTGK